MSERDLRHPFEASSEAGPPSCPVAWASCPVDHPGPGGRLLVLLGLTVPSVGKTVVAPEPIAEAKASGSMVAPGPNIVVELTTTLPAT
eukprot:725954-Pyramimonas_sp.AAC.2